MQFPVSFQSAKEAAKEDQKSTRLEVDGGERGGYVARFPWKFAGNRVSRSRGGETERSQVERARREEAPFKIHLRKDNGNWPENDTPLFRWACQRPTYSGGRRKEMQLRMRFFPQYDETNDTARKDRNSYRRIYIVHSRRISIRRNIDMVNYKRGNFLHRETIHSF